MHEQHLEQALALSEEKKRKIAKISELWKDVDDLDRQLNMLGVRTDEPVKQAAE